LPEFFRHDLIGPLSRPTDHRGDAAAIFEQTTLVLWLQAHISETGEMQHGPEAIASVREVITVGSGTGRRIETAKNNVEPTIEDIWLISDQSSSPATLARPSTCVVERPKAVRTFQGTVASI
jgi:hypothetical protein